MRTILSSLYLVFFALLAGGSLFTSGEEFGVRIVVAVVLVGIMVIIGTVVNFVKEKNKDKREEKLKAFESGIKDFDLSDSFGDDRCMVYYDKAKRKVMVVAITTDQIKKHVIDNVIKSGTATSKGIRYIIDNVNKNLIPINTDGVNIFAGKIGFASDNFEVKYNHELFPKTTVYLGTVLLIDEQNGQVLFTKFDKDRFISQSLSYSVPNERRLESFVTTNYYSTGPEGFYGISSDDKALVLIILKDTNSSKPHLTTIKYQDIISVSYIENGHTISSKSTGRTVGGAVVGGVIAGGAGAVVGGLSGNEKQTKAVSEISVKLLLRSSAKTSFTITIYSGQPLKTKDDTDKRKYDKFADSAQKIKDLISVIIDKVDRRNLQPNISQIVRQSNLNVADELMKLAKLKEQGILTEAEFAQQKEKLLNLN
jgi:hypothetical protein